MLDDKEKTRIRELRESGNTIAETAKAVGRSESTVKKYTSEDYEKDNEIDGKTAKALTDQMIEEGYDFENEIKPLVYSLKLQASEIDITLYDYLNDISNIMNKFLRITNNPEWFYYVFCELAINSFPVFTDLIEANDLINAFNNFYNREIEMENAETFITDIETKAETLLNETKAELTDLNNQINEAQKERTKIASLNSIILMKMLGAPNKERLKMSEENLKNMENQLTKLQITNQILIEKCKLLEKTDKDNEIIKQDNTMFNMVYNKLYKLFPNEIDVIIQEISNESQ